MITGLRYLWSETILCMSNPYQMESYFYLTEDRADCSLQILGLSYPVSAYMAYIVISTCNAALKMLNLSHQRIICIVILFLKLRVIKFKLLILIRHYILVKNV
jgi:hypothetical protein